MSDEISSIEVASAISAAVAARRSAASLEKTIYGHQHVLWDLSKLKPVFSRLQAAMVIVLRNLSENRYLKLLVRCCDAAVVLQRITTACLALTTKLGEIRLVTTPRDDLKVQIAEFEAYVVRREWAIRSMPRAIEGLEEHTQAIVLGVELYVGNTLHSFTSSSHLHGVLT